MMPGIPNIRIINAHSCSRTGCPPNLCWTKYTKAGSCPLSLRHSGSLPLIAGQINCSLELSVWIIPPTYSIAKFRTERMGNSHCGLPFNREAASDKSKAQHGLLVRIAAGRPSFCAGALLPHPLPCLRKTSVKLITYEGRWCPEEDSNLHALQR